MTAIPLAPPPAVVPPPVIELAAVEPAQAEPMQAEPTSSIAAPMAAREDAAVRVMLVEELDQVAAHISELLHDHQHIELIETVKEGRDAIDRITADRPDVVVIDALMQGECSGLRVARELRAAGMSTPIILLTVPDHRVALTPDMGIAEVMMLPLEGDTLLRSIARIDDSHRGAAPVALTGTFVVFSGKGGVGRTTIAHNLAASLGKRPRTSVALVDGNFVHGDLRLHLAAPDSAPSLLQMPTGHVTEVDIVPLMWEDPAGVHVLLAPPRMEQADLILQRDVENALALLRRLYDVVIIDVPAVMDDMTLAMLDGADVVLDVVTTERAAMRKSLRCRDVLAAAGYPMEKVVTVANRTDDHGLDGRSLAAELGSQPDVMLPHDSRLATGELEDGSAVVDAHPEAPISHGFASLAQALVDRATGATRLAGSQAA
jgi:pilus assembly protein CpaE